MKLKIKALIVGGCSHSMKDKEKARNVHLFSLLYSSFSPRFVSSEKRAEHVSPFEKRKENLSYRSCILLAGGACTLEKQRNFQHPTSRTHIHAFIRRVKKKGHDWLNICNIILLVYASMLNGFFVTNHTL